MNARTLVLSLLLIITVVFSAPGQKMSPVVAPDQILNSIMNWLYYSRDYLRLAEDFKAYDQSGHVINKRVFLKSISTGGYLPIRINSLAIAYQLYKLPSSTAEEMKSVIREYGEIYYVHYEQEGKVFPDFHFVDLNGRTYDREKMKGKIMVLKCWFIGCTACVQEMPQLNQLVEFYKNRNDVVFVSLVPDDKTKLNAFLKRTKFEYAVVPNRDSYITKDLNVSLYPTHFIINKKGLIVKVVNDVKELNVALNKEVQK